MQLNKQIIHFLPSLRPEDLLHLHIVVEITQSEMWDRDLMTMGFLFENQKDKQERGHLTPSFSFIISDTQLISV